MHEQLQIRLTSGIVLTNAELGAFRRSCHDVTFG
jgi:hypothetical protein